MKMKIVFLLTAAVILSACGSEKTGEANKAAGNVTAQNAQNTAAAQTSPTIDPNTPATFPFKDFPAVETTAKAGDVVLVPSFNWLQEANVKGADKVTMIWYSQKMSSPGKEMSEVEFMTGKNQVPNAYIIPIPAGQQAKKGDIVLTWWQSGSGMNRAIVVDDANPSEPVVRYLDIDYDNPAKSRDGKTTIGQMDEKLKPNSFVKIANPLEPGSAAAIQDGADMIHGQVIRAAGEKVFVKLFAGKIGVYDKSRSQPVPIVPNVKAGDKVKAERYGKFSPGTVSKVDDKIGRVWVKFDGSDKDDVVSFGDIMK